jgi:SAM-dependent methyltransferase
MSDWNHTTHYDEVLLGALPRPCARALEIGCGEGHFARRLARRAVAVDAIDRAPEVIDRARARAAAHRNLRYVVADFLGHQFENRYDFVCALASLHHLPLRPALEKMKALLRPGGVLGIIGLYRLTALEHFRDVIAWPLSRFHRLRRGLLPTDAPHCTPSLSLAAIRTEAARVLPGCVIERRILWRYTLIWIHPQPP